MKTIMKTIGCYLIGLTCAWLVIALFHIAPMCGIFVFGFIVGILFLAVLALCSESKKGGQ